MYTVVFAEHFEDWYVASSETNRFKSFDHAIRSFCDECMNVIDDSSSGSGIDNYLAENHLDQTEDDPTWFREYAKGFVFTVERDDEQVLLLHLDYDPETQSISCDLSIEVDELHLTPSQISKIQKCIVKIKMGLTRRSSGR